MIRQQHDVNSSFDWAGLLAAVMACQLVFALFLMVRPGGETVTLWVDELTLTLSSLGAALVATLAAIRGRGLRMGLGWGLIAVGLFLNTAGEAAWTVQDRVLHEADLFPSVADIGYLGLYLPVFLGLIVMPHAPADAARRLKLALDVLIGIVAVASLSWFLVLQDVLSQEAGTTELVIGMAYPVLDLAVIFAVFSLILRAGRSSTTGSLVFLALGFAAIAVSDSLYVYLQNHQSYAGNYFIDIGWTGGYGLVAISAATCAFRRDPVVFLKRARDLPPYVWQTAAVYAPAIPLAALIMADTSFRETAPLCVFMVVVGFVFIRQLLAHTENADLSRRLASAAVDLETKVRAQTVELWRHEIKNGNPHQPAPAPTRDWLPEDRTVG